MLQFQIISSEPIYSFSSFHIKYSISRTKQIYILF